MQEFNPLAKVFIMMGILLVVVGVVICFAGKIPWFGKLPGDIYIKKENYSFYFPITTCLVASLIVSAVLFFIFRK